MTQVGFLKAFVLGGTCAFVLASAAVAQTRDFNIGAGDLQSALAEYIRQSGAKLIYRDDEVRGAHTAGVHGALSADEALKLLLAGTSLTVKTDSSGARAIVHVAAPLHTSSSDGAQAPGSSGAPAGVEDEQGPTKAQPDEALLLSEVIVTGTRIRGAAPVGSELVTLGREEIIASGRTTVPELLQIVPQIQSLGAGESVVGSRSQGKVSNIMGASSVNLRGLGADATLVLINGRRPAPTAQGAFVDVSQIPLAAIERVEVLPDGASALYGSDAIGGVINFILRKNFEGAETSLNYGTGVGFHQTNFSQLFGTKWDSGSAWLSYEYSDRTNLPWYKRDYYTGNLTRFGGTDYTEPGIGNPGTIVGSDGTSYAIPHGQSGEHLTAGLLGPPGSFNSVDLQHGQDILPSQIRHSITLSAQQRLTSTVSAFVDASYSLRRFNRREIDYFTELQVTSANPYFVPTSPGETEHTVLYSFLNDIQQRHQGRATNYSFATGVNLELPRGWNGEVYVTTGQDEARTDDVGAINTARLNAALAGFEPSDPALGLPPGSGRPVPFFNPYGDSTNGSVNSAAVLKYIAGSGTNSARYNINTVDVGVNGALFGMPAGDVKLAAGAELRSEKYDTRNFYDVTNAYHGIPSTDNATSKRTVAAGYAELLVPFFGPANARAGLQDLNLSLALRTESYSDGTIGSSTNPKIGIQWRPVSGFSLRASWGTSFKAPRLQQLNEGTNIWRGDDWPNPAAVPGDPSTVAPGVSHYVYLSGFGNSQLKPETAHTLSLGFDWRPPQLTGFKASLTYYSIRYKNRILYPTDLSVAAAFGALANGGGDNIALAVHPTQAQLDTIYASDGSAASAAALAALGLPKGRFLAGSQRLPASQIYGIFSYTLRNFGAVNLSGWDADTAYHFSNRLGDFTAQAGASYLTQYEVQGAPGEAFLDLLSTSGSPIALRAHGSLSWSRGPLSAGLGVNHVGGYSNTTTGGNIPVSSWTTMDGHIAYTLKGAPGILDRTTLALDVQNLLNRDPPFVDNAIANVGYDPEVASAVGRVVSLTLRKVW